MHDLDPDRSGTLRLPPLKGTDGSVNTVAETYFKRGCVPLPHALRQGDQTISWYHGPLTPGRNKSRGIELPIRSADQLVRYNEDAGMLDVSYAVAWELGRLLTLQKTGVAVDLFNWKRAHAHEEQLRMAEKFLAHLPYEKPKTDLELPQTVTKWFADLALLHGIPFSYLVPDERMLPLESIRFFWVDWRWIECLLDGAFSVGRAMLVDHQRDRKHAKSNAKTLVQNPHEIVTGFFVAVRRRKRLARFTGRMGTTPRPTSYEIAPAYGTLVKERVDLHVCRGNHGGRHSSKTGNVAFWLQPS